MQLDKKKLYEDIMYTISKEVKRSLNENNGSLTKDAILHYMEGGHKDEIIAGILFNILSQNDTFKLYFEDYKKFKNSVYDMQKQIETKLIKVETNQVAEDIFNKKIDQIKEKLDELLYNSKS